MAKETMYWNHYKTIPHYKNTLIFFRTSGFYKTYDSDAVILAQLFGFKITLQEGLKTAAFSENSTNYLERLKDADFSYAVLELKEDGNISVLHRNTGNRTLELHVPLDTFLGFLSEIQNIHDKYETSLRMIQSIDLPFNENNHDEKYKITDIFLPDSEQEKTKQIKNKEKELNKLPL